MFNSVISMNETGQLNSQRATRTGRPPKVSLEEFNGVYRVRFTYQGKRYTLFPGLAIASENELIADSIRQLIELDIRLGKFDLTMCKYKVKSLKEDKPKQKAIALTELWDKYRVHRSVNHSPCTREAWEQMGRLLARVNVDPWQDYSGFVAELINVSTDKQAKRVLGYLKSAIEWGIKRGLTETNPIDPEYREQFRKLREHPPIAFTALERDEILQQCRVQHSPYDLYTDFIEFLFLTGCRPCEAVGLKWGKVAPNLSTVRIDSSIIRLHGKFVQRDETKTHVVRVFPLGDRVQSLLRRIKPNKVKPNDLVFPDPEIEGLPLPINYSRAFDKCMQPALVQLGLEQKDGQKITLYNTRDTFITLQCAAGISAIVIAKWVGNSTAIIERRYLDAVHLTGIKPAD